MCAIKMDRRDFSSYLLAFHAISDLYKAVTHQTWNPTNISLDGES